MTTESLGKKITIIIECLMSTSMPTESLGKTCRTIYAIIFGEGSNSLLQHVTSNWSHAYLMSFNNESQMIYRCKTAILTDCPISAFKSL